MSETATRPRIADLARVLIAADVQPFTDTMQRCAEALNRIDWPALRDAIRRAERHRPRPLPIDGHAYHARCRARARRRR